MGMRVREARRYISGGTRGSGRVKRRFGTCSGCSGSVIFARREGKPWRSIFGGGGVNRFQRLPLGEIRPLQCKNRT